MRAYLLIHALISHLLSYGFNQIKKGSEPPRYENGENLCVRWATYTHCITSKPITLYFRQILAFLRLPSSSTGPQHHEEMSVPAKDFDLIIVRSFDKNNIGLIFSRSIKVMFSAF
jgi:hypothetical protein